MWTMRTMQTMRTQTIRFFLLLALVASACAQTTGTATTGAATFTPSPAILVDSPSIAWSPTATTPDASVTLSTAVSRTLNVSGMQIGQPYTLSLLQGADGGATTLVLGTGCQWYGATGVGFGPLMQISLTASAGASDMLQISYNGTVCSVIRHSFTAPVQ